jgi:hypothetical protein
VIHVWSFVAWMTIQSSRSRSGSSDSDGRICTAFSGR